MPTKTITTISPAVGEGDGGHGVGGVGFRWIGGFDYQKVVVQGDDDIDHGNQCKPKAALLDGGGEDQQSCWISARNSKLF